MEPIFFFSISESYKNVINKTEKIIEPSLNLGLTFFLRITCEKTKLTFLFINLKYVMCPG